MIIVQQAYSRGNSGDGLLVDLTLGRLKRLFPNEPIRVYAADAGSFSDLPDVIQMPAASRDYAHRLSACIAQAGRLAAGVATGTAARAASPAALKAADLVVGVGGGYLRAPGLVQGAKFSLVNLPQLLAAGRVGGRTVYLPQSIGPFGWPLANPVQRVLTQLRAVCVRDSRSNAFIAGPNVRRMPDLAVMAIAEHAPAPAVDGRATRFIICARELGFHGEERSRYHQLIRTLLARLPQAQLAVQSRGRGNDDAEFYRRELGVDGPLPSMAEALAARPAPVVISVRLHGALSAIMRGIPALHLSYERKGFGAYEDLGLEKFVWNARTCPAEAVIAGAEAVVADPGFYWERVLNKVERVQEQSALLDQLLLEAHGAKNRSAMN